MQDLSLEKIQQNKKIIFPVKESNKSRVVGKLRYWWGWLVVALLMIFLAVPLIAIYRFRKNRDGFYEWCDWGARLWLRSCGARITVKGRENLDSNQSYVFISNHRSYLDTATLYAYAGKRMGLVAKKELLKAPIFGYGMGIANVIAIDRSNAERALKSMQKAREIMDDGYSFGVFAEGTRAMPGELLPFKKGAFHLALQTGAPIVPVAIKNTDWMMGKKTGVAYAGTIEMTLLPPIETKGLTAENMPELIAKVRGAIAAELEKD